MSTSSKDKIFCTRRKINYYLYKKRNKLLLKSFVDIPMHNQPIIYAKGSQCNKAQ